jgi:hypothetical protein
MAATCNFVYIVSTDNLQSLFQSIKLSWRRIRAVCESKRSYQSLQEESLVPGNDRWIPMSHSFQPMGRISLSQDSICDLIWSRISLNLANFSSSDPAKAAGSSKGQYNLTLEPGKIGHSASAMQESLGRFFDPEMPDTGLEDLACPSRMPLPNFLTVKSLILLFLSSLREARPIPRSGVN